MKKVKNNDTIFEDMLDDEFVNVFLPNFYAQSFLGMLGVHVKYKFVTPPTTKYKIYSVVIWVLILIFITYTVVYCSTQFDTHLTDIPMKIGTLTNSVINAGLAWKSAFLSGQTKSQLYVNLQRIERVMKMKGAKNLNSKRYKKSLLWSVFIVLTFVLWLIVFNKYLISDFCPSASVASIACIASFCIIIHICSILIFISVRVQYVNDSLARVKNGLRINVVHATSTEDSHEKIGKELIYGVSYILESFADTMDEFQLAIFFFTVQMLVWQLISMQNIVVSFKRQMTVNLLSFLSTLPCSIAFMCVMLVLCFVSQRLTNMLETSKELCIAVISSLEEGESRQNAKRIRVLLKGRREATVYDIFTLNTRLPLQLLAFTASYTIVLLQFATL